MQIMRRNRADSEQHKMVSAGPPPPMKYSQTMNKQQPPQFQPAKINFTTSPQKATILSQPQTLTVNSPQPISRITSEPSNQAISFRTLGQQAR